MATKKNTQDTQGGAVRFNVSKEEITSVLRDLQPFAAYLAYRTNDSKIIDTSNYGVTYAGLQVFKRMLDDPHIFACAQKRLFWSASLEWYCKPDPSRENDPKAHEEAEALTRALARCVDQQALLELNHAVAVGYSVSEAMWEYADGLWAPARLIGREPDRFRFGDDWELMFLSSDNPVGERIEKKYPYKFLVHSFWGLFSNRYGRGLLEKCYWPWFFKKHGWKWAMIILEKFGGPTVIVKYPQGMSAADKAAISTAINSIQYCSGIKFPNTVDYELVESSWGSGGGIPHEQMINLCNSEISKAWLGNTLTTEVGSTGGNRALGETQHGDQMDLTVFDARGLEKPVNDVLVRWSCKFNGFREPYPYFRLDTSEEEDLEARSVQYERLYNMGLEFSARQLRDEWGLEPPDGDGDRLARTAPTAQPAPWGPAGPGQAAEFARGAADRGIDRAEKVDAAALELAPELAAAYAPALEKVREKFSGLESVEAAGKIDIDVRAEIADAVYPHLLNGIIAGYDAAFDEAARQNAGETRGAEFSWLSGREFADGWEYDFYQTPDEALEHLRSLTPMAAGARDALTGLARDRAFYVAGLENEGLTALIRDQIVKAVEGGLGPNEFYDVINTAFGEAGLAGPTPWHLETVLRTNTMDAYSVGREEAENTEALRRSQPYILLLAVDDAKTRPEHRSIHMLVIPDTHEWWRKYRPPYGYNCRCTWVRVSAEYVRTLGLSIHTGPITFRPEFERKAA